jgi:lysyl-tRNA synthetase class 1
MTIDEWSSYGTADSLSLLSLPRAPTKAKKLHAGLVAHAMDDMWRSRREYHGQTVEQQRANPVHHIFPGEVPVGPAITYSNLLNLVKLIGTERIDVLQRYLSDDMPAVHEVRSMLPKVVNYFRDFIEPELNQEFYVPNEQEREALERFAQGLLTADDSSEQQLQTFAYECGKGLGYADNLRGWFKLIYQTVFGYPDGPRIGLFIAVYGRDEFVALLHDRLNFRMERFISRTLKGVTITDPDGTVLSKDGVVTTEGENRAGPGLLDGRSDRVEREPSRCGICGDINEGQLCSCPMDGEETYNCGGQ